MVVGGGIGMSRMGKKEKEIHVWDHDTSDVKVCSHMNSGDRIRVLQVMAQCAQELNKAQEEVGHRPMCVKFLTGLSVAQHVLMFPVGQ